MKLYAVIDTNVLVSALLRWDSVPGAVLEQALVGGKKAFSFLSCCSSAIALLYLLFQKGESLTVA